MTKFTVKANVVMNSIVYLNVPIRAGSARERQTAPFHFEQRSLLS